jgi:hypothetical protein
MSRAFCDDVNEMGNLTVLLCARKTGNLPPAQH